MFTRSKAERAKGKIQELDLTSVLEKANDLFGLGRHDFDKAENEYKHFLFLIWWNQHENHQEMIVPTEYADKVWHAHLLFTRDYAAMCEDIFGKFIHHNPGLDKGTASHERASRHTRRVHQTAYDDGYVGFDDDYFAFMVLESVMDPHVEPGVDRHSLPDLGDDHSSESDTDKSFTSGGGSFGGGGSSGSFGESSDSSSSSSSCGSSCGGGCGGD